jgi:peptide/nickel transport system permease protein
VSIEILDPVADVIEHAPDNRRIPKLGFLGWLSVAVIAFALFLAIFGPMLAPYDPVVGDLSYSDVGPLAGHPLGFDYQGRDVLSRLLAGARTTIFGAGFVALVAIIIGTSLALLSAWFGGKTDTFLSAALDVLFAFPGILLAVVAAAVFGASLFSAALALAIAYSPYIARVLRGAALKERAMTYISALEVQGFGAWRLTVRHLLPNISALIVAQGTILFGFAMVDLAAISFLGLGVQAPNADWGVMVSDGKTSLLLGYPLVSLSAVFCIVAVVAAVSFLGDRLESNSKGGNR